MNEGTIHVPRIKFTPAEDHKLVRLIETIGTRDWEAIALEMKNRTPRQCHDRWVNYLSPSLSSTPWSAEDDEKLEQLHKKFGKRWTKISTYFKSRSPNMIRNHFRLKEKKRQFEEKNTKQAAITVEQPAQPAILKFDIEEQFFQLFDTDSFSCEFNLDQKAKHK